MLLGRSPRALRWRDDEAWRVQNACEGCACEGGCAHGSRRCEHPEYCCLTTLSLTPLGVYVPVRGAECDFFWKCVIGGVRR